MNEFKYFDLKLPSDLHAELVELAQRDERSLHKEIVHALREFVYRSKSVTLARQRRVQR